MGFKTQSDTPVQDKIEFHRALAIHHINKMLKLEKFLGIESDYVVKVELKSQRIPDVNRMPDDINGHVKRPSAKAP